MKFHNEYRSGIDFCLVITLVLVCLLGCNPFSARTDPTRIDPFELTVSGDLDADDVSVEWVRTWAAPEDIFISDLASDKDGNIYVIGSFEGPVDFDLSNPELSNLSSFKTTYLLKYDPDGELLWELTLNKWNANTCIGIAVDEAGNTYIGGWYSGQIDFDPSDENVETRFADEHCGWLASYDPEGNFRWVTTWPGYITHLLVGDDSYLYGVGRINTMSQDFSEGSDRVAFDLDPGPGVELYEAIIGFDDFLLKLDMSGNYVWGRGFGGEGPDLVGFLTQDTEDNIYLLGSFNFDITFDPLIESTRHESPRMFDAYLVSYSSDGNYRWSQTWGDRDWTVVSGLCIIDDHLIVSGQYKFESSVDESAVRMSVDERCILWLREFTTDGEFIPTEHTDNTVSDGGGPICTVDDHCMWLRLDEQSWDSATMLSGPGSSSRGVTDFVLHYLNEDFSDAWEVTWGGPGPERSLLMNTIGSRDIVVSGIYTRYLLRQECRGVYRDLVVNDRRYASTSEAFLMKLTFDESAFEINTTGR